MDEPLRLITEHEGVFLFREAKDAGYSDAAIARHRHNGVWHRVRHGAYTFGDTWMGLSKEEQHLVRAHAVRRTTPGPVAFSHTTALLAHGVPVWGADLDIVHLTRLGPGSGRLVRGATHHEGRLNDHLLTEAGGLVVTTPGRAVVEYAAMMPLEHGLISANAAMHAELCAPDELMSTFLSMNRHQGSQKVRVLLGLADPRIASVGESRAFYLMWRGGLPAPEPQFQIVHQDRVVAIVDFAWPRLRTIVEFDGRTKYVDYVPAGDDATQVLWREKRREDLIRRLTGWAVVRIVWSDLAMPRQTCALIRESMSRAA